MGTLLSVTMTDDDDSDSQEEFLLTVRECRQKVKELAGIGDMREALRYARLGIDRLYDRCNIDSCFGKAGIFFTDAELEAMRQTRDDGGSDLFMLGFAQFHGFGGLRNNITLAFKTLCEAADLGHAFAQYYVGNMVRSGWGIAYDAAASLQYYERAADSGCAVAAFEGGKTCQRLYNSSSSGEQPPCEERLVQAAIFFSKGKHANNGSVDCSRCATQLDSVRRLHSDKIAPWGHWSPIDTTHRVLVPFEVRRAMWTWMLTSARIAPRVPHDINLMICFYVVTRPGWQLGPIKL